jgi:hypothetical protein
MIYDLTEIRRLLLYSYADLEQLRRAAHKDPIVRCALRIKQYMSRNGIATVREGMRRYAEDRAATAPRRPRATRVQEAMDDLFELVEG